MFKIPKTQYTWEQSINQKQKHDLRHKAILVLEKLLKLPKKEVLCYILNLLKVCTHNKLKQFA